MRQVDENVVPFPGERGAVADRLVAEIAAGTLGVAGPQAPRAPRQVGRPPFGGERGDDPPPGADRLRSRRARDGRIASLAGQNADLRTEISRLSRQLEEAEASASECALLARAAEERAAALEHNVAVAFRHIDEGRIGAENFLAGAAALIEGRG